MLRIRYCMMEMATVGLILIWKGLDENDYDWYGAVFSRKLRQDYGLDVSGSSDNGKTNYYTSISYLNDKGYANNQYYKRYSFRASVTSQVMDWLQMGGNLAYSYSRRTFQGQTVRWFIQTR